MNGEQLDPYIQLPNMNLSGKNLKKFVLSNFILSHEDQDGQEVVSEVDFSNTGMIIDLNRTVENQVEFRDNTRKRIIDFSKSNFDGCTIFGILPDEYQSAYESVFDGYEIRGKENLGKEYLERRKKLHDEQRIGSVSREVYRRLIYGRDFTRVKDISGVNEIHLEDYDFAGVTEQQLTQIYENVNMWINNKGKNNLSRVSFNIPTEHIPESTEEREGLDYSIWNVDAISQLTEEATMTESHGKKQVSKAGKMFNEAIKAGDFTKAKMLLQCGSQFNYTEYSNNSNIIEYTPTLYNVMQIQDEQQRKEILTMLIKKGVDIYSAYTRIDYTGEKKVDRTYCTELNKGEIFKIVIDLKERGEIPLQQYPRITFENGADKIRINPGNIGGEENVRSVVAAAKERNIPIRVGVNSGSLEKAIIGKYGRVTADGIVESALDKVAMIENAGYDNIVVSIKSSNVLMCAEAHRKLAPLCRYPLHVGITESGTVHSGNIKSAVGLGIILNEGIGDTIRISLTGDPVEEVVSAKLILKTLGLRKDGIDVVSCPTCGRTCIDLLSLANDVEKMVVGYDLDIKVAVMGCAVNGPGEAKEADIGIAGGKGEGLLIKKGEIIKKVPENELLSVLKYELDNWKG